MNTSLLQQVCDEAVINLSQYLQIDTTNPPGHEINAARFLKRLLSREGIQADIFQAAPSRANLVAILEGTNRSAKSLVLTHHMDVVEADERSWKYPPFSGKIIDGEVWGRGAIDMKSLGIAQLGAVTALKRSGIKPNRDIVFLAVADEERDGLYGTSWILNKHPGLSRNVAGVINEAGIGYFDQNGRVREWQITPSQKLVLDVKLTAKGNPGHASMPFPESAANRLIKALEKIRRYKTPIKLLPEVELYFKQISRFESGKRSEGLQSLGTALADPEFYRWFTSNLQWNALVRNTIAITQFQASTKVNVISGEASAMLNCRFLPGENPAAFLDELRKVIRDKSILIEPQNLEEPVPSSPINTRLFKTVSKVIREHHPDALIAAPPLFATTDSRFWQRRGIVAYGFFPFAFRPEELAGIHGHNERISVQNVKQGVQLLSEILLRY